MLRPCKACGGDGFEIENCSCREALCPHRPIFGSRVDPERGVYHKFWVRRTDGSSNSRGKHERCKYFVLDWDHDPFSVPAARAYAAACQSEYPEFSKDLLDLARKAELRWKRKARKDRLNA